MTDTAIISQIKEGNSKGYSMLVKRHKNRLFGGSGTTFAKDANGNFIKDSNGNFIKIIQ